MLLAQQVTLDFGYVAFLTRYLLAFGLLTVFGLVFAPTLIRSIFTLLGASQVSGAKLTPTPKTSLKRRDTDRSSDTPPPSGFSEHLIIIEFAAPNASPQVWWEYAKSEMTEAEVALAEAKLARQAPPSAV